MKCSKGDATLPFLGFLTVPYYSFVHFAPMADPNNTQQQPGLSTSDRDGRTFGRSCFSAFAGKTMGAVCAFHPCRSKERKRIYKSCEYCLTGEINASTIIHMETRLIWDEDKRLANIAKHGFDFGDACEVLDSRYRLDIPVVRNGEPRTESFSYAWGSGGADGSAYRARRCGARHQLPPGE